MTRLTVVPVDDSDVSVDLFDPAVHFSDPTNPKLSHRSKPEKQRAATSRNASATQWHTERMFRRYYAA
ncbi:MAG TPA: hypothetical protein VE422_35420 [Terriglobia bacterium]|nr:hypothetical protein [Terriglobia bacterium]